MVDSVYAVIDLGDLYLQMEGNGRGAIGRYTNLIPNSKEEFEETRADLLVLLSDEYQSEYEPEDFQFNDNIPDCITLKDNFPNPFNPTTTISFSIPDESKVDLIIYNTKGQRVKSLVRDNLVKGNHSIIWDGVNDSGKPVSSGIYFYKLSVNGLSKSTKKCLLLK